MRAFLAISTVLLLLVVAVRVRPLLFRDASEGDHAARLLASARYVGRAACASCHEPEMKLFEGSHHDLAMEPADEKTVLGDFDDSTFDHFGSKTTFSRRTGKETKYVVHTDGPDGAAADFEIQQTFGVFPLQQYLIALPGGRLQALAVSWDSRTKEAGGQRWFHLHPDEAIPASDVLHWTGPAQNWNFMCAECHSTNVKKGWRPAERRYETTYSEIDVSCEACHGPASEHVVWANSEAGRKIRSGAVAPATAGLDAAAMGLVADLDEPAATWIINMKTGLARRDRPRRSHAELDTCARCHARRSELFEDCVPGRPLLQTHKPALLDEALYFADGQQKDEVYEYGSFLQSKMYASGVSCGDCHNPHSLNVAGGADLVCAGCHSMDRFANREHHHHQADKPGASCVACHMPTRDYMVVHARRDHSIRVPRPDLTEKIGTPNACTPCHEDRSAAWASAAVKQWYPSGRWTKPHYGEALEAGRRGAPGAAHALAGLVDDVDVPGIVRASAMELLATMPSPDSIATVVRAALDADELVRSAAIDALVALPPPLRVRLGASLLRDPMRVIRVEAASALADDRESLPPPTRKAFDAALVEYRAAQATNADRPDAHANLGSMAARLGDRAEARREYDEGIAIGPWFAGLWVNLADLSREEGDDLEAERVLRRGLLVAAAKGDLHHALGLDLTRQKRTEEALDEFEAAARLEPDNTRFAYVHGIALLSAGRPQDALTVLEGALAKRPCDRDLLVALATIHRDRGELERACEYARRWVVASPGDPAAQQFLDQLEAARDGRK